MVKVQNGWEKRSLEELEALPQKHLSPSLSSGDSPRSDRRRRLSANSDSPERYVTSPSALTSPSTFSRPANGTPSSECPYPFTASHRPLLPPFHDHRARAEITFVAQ